LKSSRVRLSQTSGVKIRSALSAREVDLAFDLAAKIFGPTYLKGRNRINKVRVLDSDADFQNVLVAVSNGRVVGMIHVLPRWVYLQGNPISAFGLSHVCVHPEFQQYGYGKKLVNKALKVIHAKGSVLAIVIARRAVDGFYSKYGFVGIASFPEIILLEKACIGKSKWKYQWSIGVDESHIHNYFLAYEQTYRYLPFSYVRDDQWWSNLGLRLDTICPEGKLINVFLGKKWLGYFFLNAKGTVVEAASKTEMYELLAQSIIDYYLSKIETLAPRFSLPIAHPVISYLRRFDHHMSFRYVWNGGHMIRIMDKEAFVHNWASYVRSASNSEFQESNIQSLLRYRFRSHADVRQFILLAFGVAAPRRKGGSFPSYNALGLHPAWSLIDEF